MKRAGLIAAMWLAVLGLPALAQTFDADETAAILRFGPWPAEFEPDPTNRFDGDPAAVRVGQLLFEAPGLSNAGDLSCGACHRPDLSFTDGRPRAMAAGLLDRNTPSLLNVARQRWFGWGGANDTLWGASVRPILQPNEMAASVGSVRALLESDPALNAAYMAAFGAIRQPEVIVNVGKALAAYQATLISPKTPFDRFRDALAAGDPLGGGTYPAAAKRGLKLFLGRGNCALCHSGPMFTNGEFDDVAVPYFIGPGKVDPGRFAGLRAFRASAFTRVGPHSDAPDDPKGALTAKAKPQHKDWGAFRVPSLREAANTAPYMHDGSIQTLEGVVRHYSEINQERLHIDGVAILKPLGLTAGEIADVVAFLESLSTPRR